MKHLKKTLAVAAAFAMVGAPVIASAANPASNVATSRVASKSARVGSAVQKNSNIGGGSTIIALLAALAVIAGIAIAAGGSKSP